MPHASLFPFIAGFTVLLLAPVFAYAASPLFAMIFGVDAYAANTETLMLEKDTHNAQTMPLEAPEISPLTGAKDAPKPTLEAVPSSNEIALIATTGPLGASSSIEEEVSNVSADDLTIYVVHQGDSLPAIAQMFKVTPATIFSANDLTKDSAIHEGDVLVIPPVTGIMYTVSKGDTLGGISKTYNVSTSDISDFNNLDSAPLQPGQKIIIPGATGVISPSSKPVKVNKKERSGISSMLRSQNNMKVLANFFAWPLPAGMRQITQPLHDGDAIDLHAGVGTPALASADGTIVVAKFNGGKAWFGGFGNFIVIDHGGVKTLYAHLSAVNVSIGQHVAQGEKIGLTGNTGHSSGPHLHFAVIGAQHPYIGNTWK